MRLVQNESGTWGVQYEGKPLAIGGVTSFDSRDEAVSLIEARGLTVTEDGAIVRLTVPVQPRPPRAPEAAPVTEAQETRQTEQETAQEAEERRTGRRGRPRVYTPEEARERRREQNRRWYQRRAEEKRRADAERSKEWWEQNKDKVETYRETANERRRRRYAEDPEYRAKVIAMNKAYQQRKRAERAAQKAAEAKE